MIAEYINAWMKDGWHVTHIIWLNGEWQVNLTNDEYVVTATGKEIEDAIALAWYKAEQGEFTGRHFSLGPIERHISSILDLLPKVEFKKRSIT